MQDLADKLLRIVSLTGMTQKELAAKLGVSQPTISRVYKGGATRGGPAYRRIVEKLREVEGDVQTNSFIHELSGRTRDLQAMPAPKSVREAKALDNLIRALNEYVEARSEEKW